MFGHGFATPATTPAASTEVAPEALPEPDVARVFVPPDVPVDVPGVSACISRLCLGDDGAKDLKVCCVCVYVYVCCLCVFAGLNVVRWLYGGDSDISLCL
jgi:hypothetical protein